ncbi:MAG: type II toxin-antitoxin system RelE/ParE family toxin [Deltaproteobacteria bacterium]|nr:type II toxin-antitoxin system RelE/ParE family toxin [Deltaproteobacteria bacterium]
MRIAYYTTASGRMPVVEYIERQPKPDRARLVDALDMIERHGFDAPRVRFRQIQGKLWEIKIEGQLSHRVFYAGVSGDEIVLLHAYVKKSQKAPAHEIAVAEKRMREIL